jgi:hypothetical protein
MLWQLKKISTNETLNEPQKLPNNWGPIFGMAGVQDRLGDLSWLGEAYSDQGWFVVGEAPADPVQSTAAELAWERAKKLLQESDWSVLSDVPMTAGDKALWIEYRRSLREIRLQSGFPSDIQWPVSPA